MKARIADLAFMMGFFTPLAIIGRGRGSILMLHEVHSDGTLAQFDGCTAAQLDFTLATLRRWDIDLISMDELLPRLRSDNLRQFVVITLDDGYRDNLTHALPVFERYRAPALINVPTLAPTRELFCWWLGLRELVMTRDSLEFPAFERKVDLGSMEAKRSGYRQMQSWMAADFSRANDLRPWFESHGISFPSLCDRAFMGEDELRACAAHPLITIGGHATTHRPLASLSEPEMRDELSENRAYLESLLQVPVDHMAYPYGGKAQCGRREAIAARDAGFKTALAVRHGKLTESSLDAPHMLPREDIGYQGMSERRLYGVVNGLYGIRAGLVGA
jgi:peptidoglycan/xylan/chitin deacetylase (PgdA/CDA1 family)